MSEEKKEAPKPAQVGATVSAPELSKIVAEAVAEALKAAIPAAAVGIAQAQKEAEKMTREQVVREVMKKTKRCPICGLAESGCGGPWAKGKEDTRKPDGTPAYEPSINHFQFVVAPRDENLYRLFDGVKINGVVFKSAPGQPIWIPKKSDIPSIISNWERNEKELSQKRTAQGTGMGAIGPSGAVVTAPQGAIGWR